jgi:hypothetical protein
MDKGAASAVTNREIDTVTRTVLISFGGDCFILSSCLQQCASQNFGIRLPEAERGQEHAGLVSAARMVEIEAVVANL